MAEKEAQRPGGGGADAKGADQGAPWPEHHIDALRVVASNLPKGRLLKCSESWRLGRERAESRAQAVCEEGTNAIDRVWGSAREAKFESSFSEDEYTHAWGDSWWTSRLGREDSRGAGPAWPLGREADAAH